MFRSVFAAACLLALLVLGGANSAQAQSKPDATQLALSYLEALEAAQWEAAKAKMIEGHATADAVQQFWTSGEELRGPDKNWRGVASEKWSEGTTSEVFVPILSTGGRLGFFISVEAGRIGRVMVGFDDALFGPYAFLAGRAVVYPDGSIQRWLRYDTAVVSELRNPDGSIRRMEIIKSTSPGSLAMLRSAECPDSVCGQTGTVQDGVVSWREPKASGGFAGNFMDTKVWLEGNELVTYTTDPAPAGGIQIYDQFPELAHLRPKPYRATLVDSPPLTEAQEVEGGRMIAQLEPSVESQVGQALASQQAKAQYFADEHAKRQRSSERVRSFNRAMEGMNGVLTAANDVATENEARSRAELDATIAQMNAQAALQRQQQNSPHRASGQPAQAPQQQVASSDAASAAAASPADVGQNVASPSQPAVAAPAAGKSLRFVMSISLRNQPGDTVNPTCYSNVITRDGPPGWGASGFLPPGSGEQARQTVMSLKSAFIAQCQASGREITSDGNFNFQLNQSQGDEQRLQELRPRHREDVSVSMN